MICEWCGEDTEVGTSHYVHPKTGKPSCPRPQKCPTCGDPISFTACAGCARRDYEGMRDMQRKFIEADHKWRALELQNQEMRKVLEWLDRKGGLGLDVHERIRAIGIYGRRDEVAPFCQVPGCGKVAHHLGEHTVTEKRVEEPPKLRERGDDVSDDAMMG